MVVFLCINIYKVNTFVCIRKFLFQIAILNILKYPIENLKKFGGCNKNDTVIGMDFIMGDPDPIDLEHCFKYYPIC